MYRKRSRREGYEFNKDRINKVEHILLLKHTGKADKYGRVDLISYIRNFLLAFSISFIAVLVMMFRHMTDSFSDLFDVDFGYFRNMIIDRLKDVRITFNPYEIFDNDDFVWKLLSEVIDSRTILTVIVIALLIVGLFELGFIPFWVMLIGFLPILLFGFYISVPVLGFTLSRIISSFFAVLIRFIVPRKKTSTSGAL